VDVEKNKHIDAQKDYIKKDKYIENLESKINQLKDQIMEFQEESVLIEERFGEA